MPWPERIVVDPAILAGKPVIRGTRLAAELILEPLAAGQSESEILADENFPLPLVETLRQQEHDVEWARIDCPGLANRRLLERAEAGDRIVPTLDQDFRQLALQPTIPLKRCGVILFRAFPATPEIPAPLAA